MPCFRPLTAYRSYNLKTKNGKAQICFKRKESGILSEEIQLPCGQCIGCRIERSKQWALRCVHESSLYGNNCFITLTFDDNHLNSERSLVKSDFQKFMKRLRKSYHGKESITDDKGKVSFPIRFFHCGEYGSQLERPHHHACLFNFDFDDKILWSVRKGVKLYRSPELEKLWPYGFCTIGDVTYESAAYVARYVTKKVNGERAAAHYARVNEETGEMFYVEPEYITMSRRPGIAKNWFQKYQKDVYPSDFVTLKGKKFKPPAYYDKIYDLDNHQSMEAIKRQRMKRAKEHADNNTPRRRVVREECQRRKVTMLKRGLES